MKQEQQRPPVALTWLDRTLVRWLPETGMRRLKARAVSGVLMRHLGYEAAMPGRRNDGFRRVGGDANAVNGMQVHVLRDYVRDMVRNNPWARRGLQVIANNVVGWGIVGKPAGSGARAMKRARELWNAWALTTQCDITGKMNFYGLQRLVIRTVARDGEALVRRHVVTDRNLAIPMQLQVIEADYLDTGRNDRVAPGGNRIIRGVEVDGYGRPVAYWLFTEHPGSTLMTQPVSVRVPADEIAHVFEVDRPGQNRAATWFHSVIARLRNFDVFEDAQLLQQQIAACFAAFITDTGDLPGSAALGDPVGDQGTNGSTVAVESIEPGQVQRLPIGKQITFAEPPSVTDTGFDERQLRAYAAGIGITYEDASGDYSKVNFSSARMGRIAHWANVHDWRWTMLIPQFCERSWSWAFTVAFVAGLINEVPSSAWTPPPMAMIEPDKEGLAYIRNVRAGMMTPDEMVREQGLDPDTHWTEYAAQMDRLRKLGIVLDIDAKERTQQGNPTVMRPAAATKPAK
jgi:lambda family phage portal protein